MAIIIDLSNDTAFYDSVRRLLGGVDEDILPDLDISDASILDMAEMQVIDLVPSFATLPVADKARVRLAVIYVTASQLCPTMASRVDYEVRTIDVTWKRKPIDYNELAITLMGKVVGLLDNLISGAGGDSIIFAIAPSKRAVNAREDC
jgi:hypothetical protein